MMRPLVLALFALLCMAPACPAPTPPPPQPPVVVVDASPAAADAFSPAPTDASPASSDDCARTGAKLAATGCIDVEAVPRYVDACRNASGVIADFNLPCLLDAKKTTPAALRTCRSTKCPAAP